MIPAGAGAEGPAVASSIRVVGDPVPHEQLSWPGRADLWAGWTLLDPDDRARTKARTAAMLARAYGRRPCFVHQVHSARVVEAEYWDTDAQRPRADGLITSRRDLLIAVGVADCAPLFVVGESAVSIVHAGWRGVVGGILASALRCFQHRFGVPVDRLEMAIGPSIGACCFEVSAGVAMLFPPHVRRLVHDRHFVDMPGAIADQWLRLGGRYAQLFRFDRCTVCSQPLFHSFRRDRGTGRNIAYLRFCD